MILICTYLVHVMQEISDSFKWPLYTQGMRTGRPTDQPRSPFGERLVKVRQQAGLSQTELADTLDVDRRVIAHWVRHSVTLKPEQLIALAKALNVSTDELLGLSAKSKRSNGPSGKMRKLFDAASQLPRSQQKKIFDLLEPFVTEHSR